MLDKNGSIQKVFFVSLECGRQKYMVHSNLLLLTDNYLYRCENRSGHCAMTFVVNTRVDGKVTSFGFWKCFSERSFTAFYCSAVDYVMREGVAFAADQVIH